jgi:hypothetical protein
MIKNPGSAREGREDGEGNPLHFLTKTTKTTKFYCPGIRCG